jgi:hypothetical protein
MGFQAKRKQKLFFSLSIISSQSFAARVLLVQQPNLSPSGPCLPVSFAYSVLRLGYVGEAKVVVETLRSASEFLTALSDEPRQRLRRLG